MKPEYVLTGEFDRDKVKATIIANGGQIADRLHSGTAGLIYGDNPGSKLQRAEMLGVRCIPAEEV